MGQVHHAEAKTTLDLSDEPKQELTLTFSPETADALNDLAGQIGGTRADVFERALALFDLALQAKKQGKRLGIIDQDGVVETEITGLTKD